MALQANGRWMTFSATGQAARLLRRAVLPGTAHAFQGSPGTAPAMPAAPAPAPRLTRRSRGFCMAIDLPAPAGRRIALIAHDNNKQDMLEWAEYNLTLLAG